MISNYLAFVNKKQQQQQQKQQVRRDNKFGICRSFLTLLLYNWVFFQLIISFYLNHFLYNMPLH